MERTLHGPTPLSQPEPFRPSRVRATETSDKGNLPALPEEVWTYIFHICAATSIQATFRGFKTRHGPVRYLAKCVTKAWRPPVRAVFWDMEFQPPSAVRYVLLDTPGGTGKTFIVSRCVD